MGVANKVGDLAFKGFTAALGVATVYLAGTFSVNVYRGLSWHKEQSKINKEASESYEAQEPLGERVSRIGNLEAAVNSQTSEKTVPTLFGRELHGHGQETVKTRITNFLRSL